VNEVIVGGRVAAIDLDEDGVTITVDLPSPGERGV
jgi:hypothetical protein